MSHTNNKEVDTIQEINNYLDDTVHKVCQYYVYSDLKDLVSNIEVSYHQELQKAREEERERCITEAWSYIVDATHAESWGREELRKRLTPPDQTANPTN